MCEGMDGCCAGMYIVSTAGARLFHHGNPPDEPDQSSGGVMNSINVYARTQVVSRHTSARMAG